MTILSELNKTTVLLAYIAVTGALALLHALFITDYLQKLVYSAAVLTTFYFLFKIVAEAYASSRVKDSRSRYSFRKISSVLYLALSLTALIIIWIQDPQAVLVSYGIIAAGAAISLQDFFRNFVGGLVILYSGAYHVGDRIEIESKVGDVVDIGLIYTTILELRGWVDGDQATGRLTLIPNGLVIGKMVNNYSKDYGFIWDEITIPITYQSDWRKAKEIMKAVAMRETAPYLQEAGPEMAGAIEKYYLTKRMIEPTVNLLLTDNWIKLSVRYVARVKERREIENTISEKTLETFEGTENIIIASQTISIVDFPLSDQKA